MSCPDDAPRNSLQQSGSPRLEASPRGMKALEALTAAVQKGTTQARAKLRQLREKAAQGDDLAFRALLQAAIAPASVGAKDRQYRIPTCPELREMVLDYLFDRDSGLFRKDFALPFDPAPYLLAALQGMPSGGHDPMCLALRWLKCEAAPMDEAQRQWLTAWLLRGMDTQAQESGKTGFFFRRVGAYGHDYDFDFGSLRPDPPLTPSYLLRLLKNQSQALPAIHNDIHLLQRIGQSDRFPVGLTEEARGWLRAFLAERIPQTNRYDGAASEHLKQVRGLAARLIDRIDAADVEDRVYLTEFYGQGRGDRTRAANAVRHMLADDFAGTLSQYEAFPEAVRALLMEQAAQMVLEAPERLDPGAFRRYWGILRSRLSPTRLDTPGLDAVLRSSAANATVRAEACAWLRHALSGHELTEAFAAYRVLRFHRQLPPRIPFFEYTQSLLDAPALAEKVDYQGLKPGMLVRSTGDRRIAIYLGQGGRDYSRGYSGNISYGSPYFRNVIQGPGSSSPLGEDGIVHSLERWDVLIDDERNAKREKQGVLEWGNASGAIETLVEKYRENLAHGGDFSGRLATRFVESMDRRADLDQEVFFRMQDGTAFSIPLRFYRFRSTGTPRIQLKAIVEKQGIPEIPDEIDLDEVEKAWLERSPVLLSADARRREKDLGFDILCGCVETGAALPEWLFENRPDLQAEFSSHDGLEWLLEAGVTVPPELLSTFPDLLTRYGVA